MSIYCEQKNKSEIMAGIDSVKSKFIARNTVQYETESGDIVTRYHVTDVAVIHPDKSVNLSTGGWSTKTTRERMNLALPSPWCVYTDKAMLFVSNGKKSAEFKESCYIGPKGKIVSDIGAGGAVGFESYRPKIDKWIKALLADGIPISSGGDPWVLPDSSGKYSPEYVEGWLAETYVFQNFVRAAIKYSGATDFGVNYWMLDFNSGKGNRAYITGKVRRYFRACLGFSA